ncbi:hypothetical protein GGR58DRAFT_505327 [Xylaria digitata]|nr:hypothetical protein GGR58DRAFT_505327 [Xylaria digitata]
MSYTDTKRDRIIEDAVLRDYADYPNWFTKLQYHAESKNVWHLIDPNAPDSKFRASVAPKRPSPEIARESIFSERMETHTRLLKEWQETGNGIVDRPVLSQEDPKPEEISKRLTELIAYYPSEVAAWTITANRYSAVNDWVIATVSSGIINLMTRKITLEGTITLQALLRAIGDFCEPTKTSTESAVQTKYREALRRASLAGVKPEVWYNSWFDAYLQAVTYDLPDVKGGLAVRNFLEAISARIAPEWARQQIAQYSMDEQLGRPTLTLENYGRIFSGLMREEIARGRSSGPGIFATLGERSSDQSGTGGTPNSGPAKPSGSPKPGYPCPCRPNKETHRWPPQSCGILQKAVTGSTEHPRVGHLSPDQVKDIKVRYGHTHWSELRNKINSEGWSVREDSRGSDRGRYPRARGGGGGSGRGSGGSKWPDPNLVFTVIDQGLLTRALPNPGVYTTLGYGLHPLSQSTVLNNCGALHLVNNRALLEPGSLILAEDEECVDVGTTSFPIVGRGKRIIKGAFSGVKGPNTVDLLLENVALVEGFHVNIVSEARLRNKEIWYCGFDCSLRYGSMASNEKAAKQIDTALIKSITTVAPIPKGLLDTVNVWEVTLPNIHKQSSNPPAEVGGEPTPDDRAPKSQSEELKSGVRPSGDQQKEVPKDRQQGLMTPQITPEPDQQPARSEEISRSAEHPLEDQGSAEQPSEHPRSLQEVHSTRTEKAIEDLLEDPAENCIVPTRSSRRIRGEPPEIQPSEGIFSVFTTQIYGDQEITPPYDHHWSTFLETFLLDQQKAIYKGDREHKTLYAVFAAAVNQYKAERLRAYPKEF